uniref:ORF83 n=1 Tax=Malaco herpesvirus 4 TaxID=3031800 RepID=A0AA48P7W7_9VIRU|nr:TPA_asm: ORF83 [Malaco herpesvirus 4]
MSDCVRHDPTVRTCTLYCQQNTAHFRRIISEPFDPDRHRQTDESVDQVHQFHTRDHHILHRHIQNVVRSGTDEFTCQNCNAACPLRGVLSVLSGQRRIQAPRNVFLERKGENCRRTGYTNCVQKWDRGFG